MSYRELELKAALAAPLAAGLIDMVPDQLVVDGLDRAFPFTGSRVDWRRLNGRLTSDDTDPEAFGKFFDRRCLELGLESRAYYLSEIHMDYALVSSLFVLKRYLPQLIAAPDHHYFVDERFRWCLCYSFEGDVDFGWAPGAG